MFVIEELVEEGRKPQFQMLRNPMKLKIEGEEIEKELERESGDLNSDDGAV